MNPPRPIKRSAHWVAPTLDPAQETGVFVFKREFRLDFVPTTWWASVSADPRYRLYLNGHLLALGPQRADLKNWRYETIDFAPHLQSGPNTLHAIVWNPGPLAALAQISYRTAFLLEADPLPILDLSTPKGWYAARLPTARFAKNELDMLATYWVGAPNLEIEAPDADWPNLPQAPHLDWKPAHAVSRAKTEGSGEEESPWWLKPRDVLPPDLNPQPHPLATVNPHTDQRAPFQPQNLTPGQTLLLDTTTYQVFHYSFGFRSITTNPTATHPDATNPLAPTTIKIATAESLFKNPDPTQHDWDKADRNQTVGKTFRGHYDQIQIPTSHTQASFHTLDWRCGRYIQISTDQPVEITRAQILPTFHPHPLTATFQTPEPGICEIWDTALHTLRCAAQETYVDGPYYEDLQYAADTRIQALCHYYLSQDRHLQRQAVQQFFNSRQPDGLIETRFPCREHQIIGPFNLWWACMLFDNILYDPQSPFADNSHPATQAARQAPTIWWERAQEGKSHWLFADWVEEWPWGVPPGGHHATVHRLTQLLTQASDPFLSPTEKRPSPKSSKPTTKRTRKASSST